MSGKIINKKTYVFTGDRIEKAKQIESVLSDFLQTTVRDYKILDLGCGDGEIGRYFSKYNDVTLADIEDQRLVKTTKFILLDKEYLRLPFKDDIFDIVISNHVIEHLSQEDLNDAENHLYTIHKVLNDQGICYFTTPNKNYPIEPHHKIPLIHYFWEFKDIKLLSTGDMKRIILSSGFGYKDYTTWLISRITEYNVPKWLSWLAPTNVFILVKK